MKYFIMVMFLLVTIITAIMIVTFGFSTVFGCGAIESVPVGKHQCWNPVTGTIYIG